MTEPALSLSERRAYEMLGRGRSDAAIEAADWVDHDTPAEHLGERIRAALAAPWAEGNGPNGTILGMTDKQSALLCYLVTEENRGLGASELEPMMARSLHRNYIGWGAGDLTTTLHRMMRKGLVRREERKREKLRDPKWVWFATPLGEALNMLWLIEVGAVTEDEAVQIEAEDGWARAAVRKGRNA